MYFSGSVQDALKQLKKSIQPSFKKPRSKSWKSDKYTNIIGDIDGQSFYFHLIHTVSSIFGFRYRDPYIEGTVDYKNGVTIISAEFIIPQRISLNLAIVLFIIINTLLMIEDYRFVFITIPMFGIFISVTLFVYYRFKKKLYGELQQLLVKGKFYPYLG